MDNTLVAGYINRFPGTSGCCIRGRRFRDQFSQEIDGGQRPHPAQHAQQCAHENVGNVSETVILHGYRGGHQDSKLFMLTMGFIYASILSG